MAVKELITQTILRNFSRFRSHFVFLPDWLSVQCHAPPVEGSTNREISKSVPLLENLMRRDHFVDLSVDGGSFLNVHERNGWGLD
jgi:hypothetical protein